LISTIESNASSSANLKAVLHALLLLKEVVGVFPKQQLKLACETVLKVMTLGNAVTVSFANVAKIFKDKFRPP
jgi:hypothetical protein